MVHHNTSSQHEQHSTNHAKESSTLQKKSALGQQKSYDKDNSPSADQNKSELSSCRFWLPNIIQGILTLITLGTLIVMYFQLISIQKQTRTLQAQQINLTQFREGQPISALVVFRNSGKSPALKVTIYNNIHLRSVPVPVPMPLGKYSGRTSEAVIGPYSDFGNFITAKEALTTKDIEALTQKKKDIYVWGRIEYDDIFNQHRRTEYCFVDRFRTTTFNACTNNNTAN